MIDTLVIYVITACMITGVWVTLQEGMIFSKVRKVMAKAPEFFHKPLFECMICMTSIWGGLFYFTVWQMPLSWELIPYLLSVAGLLTIVSFSIGE